MCFAPVIPATRQACTSYSATAERVRKVAAELGYVRDPLASGLRRVGTSTVGVSSRN